MADTPKIKLMSNLNLNDNSFIIKDTTRITFPDNPIEGIECLVNGINYIYTILDGFLSWIPTSINRETKNFTIEPAEQNWVISHNWNTDISKLDIICYNSDNKVITGNIAQIDKNSFSVAFSSAVAGRITLFNSVGSGAGLTEDDQAKLDKIETIETKIVNIEEDLTGIYTKEDIDRLLQDTNVEGQSTLSSPILNQEVLTEYRHPISGKPIYTKTIKYLF